MKSLFFIKAIVVACLAMIFMKPVAAELKPTSFNATAKSCKEVNVTWDVSNITGYSKFTLYESLDGGQDGTYSSIKDISSKDSYNKSLFPSYDSRTYCYKIVGTTSSKTTDQTKPACATIPPIGPVTPGKPIPKVLNGQNNVSVFLTWDPNPSRSECEGHSAFEIDRQSGINPMSFYSYSPQYPPTYTDNNVSSGNTYVYQVIALLNDKRSPPTPTVSVPVIAINLSVGISGNGTVSGPGISCPSDCKEVFGPGTPVSLKADWLAGYKFAKWQGVPCNQDNPCSFMLNSSTTVTAVFVPDTTPPTVSLTSPTAGQTRLEAVNLAAQASDDVGFTKVEFFANTTLLGTVTAAPYQKRVIWNPQLLPYGTYNFTAKAYDAAGNVSISAPVQASVISGQLILNPGFETQATGWKASAGVINNGPSSQAHSGNGYATLHLSNLPGPTDDVYQQVTIPSDAVTANLSFWLRVDSALSNGGMSYDKLTVSVRDTTGQILGLLGTYSSVNKTTGYIENRFDMSAYKGKTIRLYFQSTKPDKPFILSIDDDLYLSQSLDKSLLFYLDDVTLTATQ